MKKDKKVKIFKFVFLLLFIIYMTIYVSQLTGYYEYKNYQKALLTKEQIVKFENDVKNGKNIKDKDYINAHTKNYDNLASNIGYTLSEQIGNFMTSGVDTTMEFLTKLFNG